VVDVDVLLWFDVFWSSIQRILRLLAFLEHVCNFFGAQYILRCFELFWGKRLSLLISSTSDSDSDVISQDDGDSCLLWICFEDTHIISGGTEHKLCCWGVASWPGFSLSLSPIISLAIFLLLQFFLQ
jgi:hypothetical protein